MKSFNDFFYDDDQTIFDDEEVLRIKNTMKRKSIEFGRRYYETRHFNEMKQFLDSSMSGLYQTILDILEEKNKK